MKEETIKYLKLYLLSLYEILTIINKYMFLLFNVQMTDNLTISGISMNIFMNKFYKNNKEDQDLPHPKLPLITSSNIF